MDRLITDVVYISAVVFVHGNNARNKGHKLIDQSFEDPLLIVVLLKYIVILADQNGFGWPNFEIGWKMVNGKQLFLALWQYGEL